MNLIQQLEQEEIARLGKTIPDFAPGDTVIVKVKWSRKATASVVQAYRRRGDRQAQSRPQLQLHRAQDFRPAKASSGPSRPIRR